MTKDDQKLKLKLGLVIASALIMVLVAFKYLPQLATQDNVSSDLVSQKSHSNYIRQDSVDVNQGDKPTNSPSLVATTPESHDQIEFAQSLEGTDIDGALKVDKNGLLILDQDVRDFFDYFLSAADELGPEAVILEIQRYIDTYLPQAAAIQAHKLFSGYLSYKQFEFQLRQQPLEGAQLSSDSLQLVRENFEALKNKRRELFSIEEDEALFGLEQTYQEFTLQTLELFADDAITDEQRMFQLAELETTLPPELQASRAEDANHRVEQKQVDQLSAQHSDDAAFHQALTDRGINQIKADELVTYRQQQQRFDQTYQRYRTAVNALDKNDAQYQQSLNQLQTSFFVDPEQVTQARLRDLSKK